MQAVTFLALAVVAAMAWALAARRREHRPVAVLLSIGLVTAIAESVIGCALLAPLRDELGVNVAWTGWARAAGLLYDAAAMVWPAALVGAALVVFADRKPWAAIVGWALAVVAFAVTHPIAGDGSLERAFAVVAVLSAVTSAALGVQWLRGRTAPATTAQHALMMIVLAELVSLLGWPLGLFAGWPISQALHYVMFVVLVLVQGRLLWTTPPQSQPSA